MVGLYHVLDSVGINRDTSAAFGWLCVETTIPTATHTRSAISAAFGRLCVETWTWVSHQHLILSAALRQLSVKANVLMIICVYNWLAACSYMLKRKNRMK